MLISSLVKKMQGLPSLILDSHVWEVLDGKYRGPNDASSIPTNPYGLSPPLTLPAWFVEGLPAFAVQSYYSIRDLCCDLLVFPFFFSNLSWSILARIKCPRKVHICQAVDHKRSVMNLWVGTSFIPEWLFIEIWIIKNMVLTHICVSEPVIQFPHSVFKRIIQM